MTEVFDNSFTDKGFNFISNNCMLHAIKHAWPHIVLLWP